MTHVEHMLVNLITELLVIILHVFFCGQRRSDNMPENKFQRAIFALITVIITVPCFVFYCLSIEDGGILNVDLMFALKLIPIEFVLAYLSEIFIGSPLSVKLALKAIPPKEYKPMIVETAIICATVCIMCPLMSFFATILYHGIFPGLIYHQTGFQIGNFFLYFIPNFLQTFVQNFPFALLSQLFFIQPLTHKIFKLLFRK